MLKLLIFSVVFASAFLTARSGVLGKMMGPGVWSVINLKKCDSDEKMEMKIEVSRHKINRSHDGFDGSLKLKQAIDDSYAMRIDLCKIVDGGCKPYQTLADNSFENFVKKYAESNFKRALELTSCNCTGLPMPAGSYSITNYVIDYKSLPENCEYGEFSADAYLIKDNIEKACLNTHVKCEEKVDDNDED